MQIDETIQETDVQADEERPLRRKTIRRKYKKPTVDRIIELAEDMVDEALEEAYKLVCNKSMPPFAVFTQIRETVCKLDEAGQKKILAKFKEILKG